MTHRPEFFMFASTIGGRGSSFLKMTSVPYSLFTSAFMENHCFSVIGSKSMPHMLQWCLFLFCMNDRASDRCEGLMIALSVCEMHKKHPGKIEPPDCQATPRCQREHSGGCNRPHQNRGPHLGTDAPKQSVAGLRCPKL